MILFQNFENVKMPVDSYMLERWLKIFKPHVMLEGPKTHQELVFFSSALHINVLGYRNWEPTKNFVFFNWALNVNVLVECNTDALDSLFWTQIVHVGKSFVRSFHGYGF